MVVVTTPSANVTVTPANATGEGSVATSKTAVGDDGLALRVASSRRVESATKSFTSRAGRPATSQLNRTLSPKVSTVSASPPPALPPPITISFGAARPTGSDAYAPAADSTYVDS